MIVTGSGVGDGEFVPHRLREEVTQFVGSIVEGPGTDRRGQLCVVGDTELRETFAVRRILGWAQLDLALDHPEHVGGHAGVEPQPTVGGRDHLAVQPLAHGLQQLDRRWRIVGGGHLTTARPTPPAGRARSRTPDGRSRPVRGCVPPR